MPKMALNATSSLTSTCPPHKKREDYYDCDNLLRPDGLTHATIDRVSLR